jgi:hypothetical protein
MKKRSPEIFLSHAVKDIRFVDRLAASLIESGLRVWRSESHLDAAEHWLLEIGHALNRCDWFLIVLSPHALESMWVSRELSYALAQKRLFGRIVPVLAKTCDWRSFSWALETIQVTDFRKNFDRSFEQLLRLWK